ncbi:MAG: formylglycine-generating enzyme family protein, partial [Prochloraceae cyanobacterium]
IGCLPSSWSVNNFEQKKILGLSNQKFKDSQIERCEIKNTLLSQIITTYSLEFQTVQLNEKGQESQKSTVQNTYFSEDLGNAISLDMVLIPNGSFIMGAPKKESKSYDRERPQHKVNVSSFFMGRYPITQAQWKVVAGWGKVEIDLDPDPSRFKEDYEGITRWNRPVEYVNWEDAIEFCKRLSKRTGREYRLPSEAQWEYACRAGTTTPFHFGETISAELANYNGNFTYGQGVKGKYREQTTPVGYFKVANNFGLYDMHGNVLEWCEDNLDSKNAPLRGGGWFYAPDCCRSAYRFTNHMKSANIKYFGFRVVCGFVRHY